MRNSYVVFVAPRLRYRNTSTLSNFPSVIFLVVVGNPGTVLRSQNADCIGLEQAGRAVLRGWGPGRGAAVYSRFTRAEGADETVHERAL